MDKKQCNSCGKPKCSCKNKEFTKAVIEIDNPEQITLMRRVVIPASMGDDTTVPPVVGKYKNVLLYYEANHKSYLYSSDGIPTLLANGLTDYEEAVNLPEINGHTLLGNQTGPELGLQNTLSVIPDTGIQLENNELSGLPATDDTIGMVKPGDGLEVATDGTMSISDIEQYAHFFDTVADMKAATNLVAGDYARTGGFYAINDGGGALYKITDTGTANEMDVIAVGDLYANFVNPLVVSPEMFGAYGDGTHDDTNAWNKAVSVGKDVKAFEKTYLVSTINVSDDINIDCGDASFICSTTRLFIIAGEVVASLSGESDYTANDIDYFITDADYSSYTGFALIHGDNNFEESRDSYRGGFVCTFDNGKICASYPIPVTNPVIDIINPIKGSLKNIKNITHQTLTNANRSIFIQYAEGYVVENLHGKNLQAYHDININKSINVSCTNLNITHDITFNDDVSYIICIEDSSFCNVTNSYLYNKRWHAWTSSGIYLCYKNSVTDSTLLSDSPYSALDHDNALGTTFENLTATCLLISGLGYVNNVKLYSCKDTQRRCNIALSAPSIAENSKFIVTNAYLNLDANANGTYCGIFMNKAPQVTGKSYTFTDIYVDNVKTNKAVLSRTYFGNLPNTSNFTIKKVTVKNSTLEIVFPTTSNSHIDTSTSEVYIDGDNEYVISKYGDVGNSNAKFNKLVITNSHIRQISGSCTTLVVNNVEMANTSSGLSATNIYGGVLLSRIDFDVLKNATIVNISNMQYNATAQHFNFVKAGGTVYYQEVNTSTGLFETKTIA